MADVGGCSTEPGDAKVCQQQVGTIRVLLVSADEEVGGLNILVNDVTVMGMLEGICGLAYEMRDILCT